MSVSQQELETSSNNVANANTPGYSREIADTRPGDPVVYTPLTFGTGVVLDKIQSVRDPILEIQLNQETQQQSSLNAQLEQLQQIQTQFVSSSSGIGADISNFFSSLQKLSPDSTNLALRQGVLTAAGNLASDFNNASNSLPDAGQQPQSERRPGHWPSELTDRADREHQSADCQSRERARRCERARRPAD